MGKLLVNLIFVAFCCLFSGCATQKKSLTVKDDTRVVVHCTILYDKDKKIPCRTTWVNKISGKTIVINDGMKTVDAGDYTLIGIYGETDNYFSNERFNVSDIEDIASVNVPDGKVVYAGHVVLNTRHSFIVTQAISIKDGFNYYKKFLDNKYPLLSHRLIKSLVELRNKK